MFDKFNIGSLMKGAKKIQEMVEKNQEEMGKLEMVGESGAGLVKVVITGLYEVKEVSLTDELLTESKEVIQDLIAAAVNNATQKVGQITRGRMTDISQLFGEEN